MKTIKKILHYLGIHNHKCERRIFTTKNTYICMVTGKKHRKWFKTK